MKNKASNKPLKTDYLLNFFKNIIAKLKHHRALAIISMTNLFYLGGNYAKRQRFYLKTLQSTRNS